MREFVLQEAPEPEGDKNVPVLAQRFGREKIAFLEDEAVVNAEQGKLRDQVLPVALKYQLMSRFTSLVAVDTQPARNLADPVKNQAIPNAMPAGSAMQAVGFPQTATGVYWHWLAGLLAAFGLWFLHRKGGGYAL